MTGQLWLLKVRSTRPEARCQSFTVQSAEAEAAYAPSGEIARDRTCNPWCGRAEDAERGNRQGRGEG